MIVGTSCFRQVAVAKIYTLGIIEKGIGLVSEAPMVIPSMNVSYFVVPAKIHRFVRDLESCVLQFRTRLIEVVPIILVAAKAICAVDIPANRWTVNAFLALC